MEGSGLEAPPNGPGMMPATATHCQSRCHRRRRASDRDIQGPTVRASLASGRVPERPATMPACQVATDRDRDSGAGGPACTSRGMQVSEFEQQRPPAADPA